MSIYIVRHIETVGIYGRDEEGFPWTTWMNAGDKATERCADCGEMISSGWVRGQLGDEFYVCSSHVLQLPAELTKQTVFPSAKALLDAGISCREVGGKGGWSVYWMEFGCELTLFPGSEGPQEMNSVDELIEALGGDQPAVLTVASLKRFGVGVDQGRRRR